MGICGGCGTKDEDRMVHGMIVYLICYTGSFFLARGEHYFPVRSSSSGSGLVAVFPGLPPFRESDSSKGDLFSVLGGRTGTGLLKAEPPAGRLAGYDVALHGFGLCRLLGCV